MTYTEEYFLNLVKEGRLVVSEQGTVFNTQTKRFIGTSIHKDGGHHSVCCVKDGKARAMLVHRLVWIVFKGEIPKDMRIVYKGEKLNDALDNLEMLHHSDNCLRCNAPRRIGAANLQSKLNDEIVAACRARYRQYENTSSLAKEFGVSLFTMNHALTGKTWSHVPFPITREELRLTSKKLNPKKRGTPKPRVAKPKTEKISQPKVVVKKVAVKKVDRKIKMLASSFLKFRENVARQ